MEKQNKVVVITLPKKDTVLFYAFLFLGVVINVFVIYANTGPFATGKWEPTAGAIWIFLFLFGFSVYLLVQLRKLKEIIKVLLNQIDELKKTSDSN
jgi:hypothetical protein